MNAFRALPAAVAALLAIVGSAAPSRAVPLAIANSSFESPVFADASFGFQIPVAQQGAHGWTMSDGAFIYNPQAGDYTGAAGNGAPQGALGAQVSGVYGFGDYALGQRLAGADAIPGNTDDPVVEVGTVYTVTFSIGQRAAGNPFGGTWGGYDVQLIAGAGSGAILLGHEADAVTPPPGQFVTRSFSVVSPTLAHPEAVGLPLTILLRKTFQTQSATVEYDNLQIDVGEIAPELNANFDGLGGVDGLDLARWSANFGATSLNATHAHGNADGDDFVDGTDFLLWQRQRSSAVALAAPVPEPPATALAAVLALVALLFQRSRL